MKRIILMIFVLMSGIFCFFCKADGQLRTVAYPCLGIPQYFSVPPGVTEINVEVVGSDGTPLLGISRSGRGARVTAIISVTPASVLTIFAGCKTGYGFTRGVRSRHPFFEEFNLRYWRRGVAVARAQFWIRTLS